MSNSEVIKYPYLGFGLGLRAPHYTDIIEQLPRDIDWFEILTENYLVPGGKPLYYLNKIKEQYPLVMHGVSLSIGSTDPLDWSYLKEVKALVDIAEPRWISDHLCWTGVKQLNMHDLLPLPYTQEAIKHVVNRIKEVQDFFGQRILIENVSSYVTFKSSVMPEWDFYTTVCEEADCLMLLDINNIYVSSYNHQFDPISYIDAMPVHRVQQYHLAGHSNMGDHIIDTHDATIISEVWDLYQYAVNRFGQVSTMIERDDHIPPLTDLIKELNYAKSIALTHDSMQVSTA